MLVLPTEGDLRGREHGAPPGAVPAMPAASASSGAQPALHQLMQPKETATKITVNSITARLQKE